MIRPLPPSDVAMAMTGLTGWALSPHAHLPIRCLTKSWTFPTFEAAVARFNRIAALAQHLDHHPEVVSSYTELRVSVWTHEATGLTHRDFALARAIDELTHDTPARPLHGETPNPP